jgi:hydrogenase maturation protease
MSLPRPIRVVGCGSALGDDALGWEVVRRLRAQCLCAVELHVAENGHRILDVLDGDGTLIVVDAVSSGGPPGTIHRFDWPHQGVQFLRPGSTHALSPATALRLAATLGMLPPRVIVFGVEVESLGATVGLSGRVTSALPDLMQRIAELVRRKETRRSMQSR